MEKTVCHVKYSKLPTPYEMLVIIRTLLCSTAGRLLNEELCLAIKTLSSWQRIVLETEKIISSKREAVPAAFIFSKIQFGLLTLIQVCPLEITWNEVKEFGMFPSPHVQYLLHSWPNSNVPLFCPSFRKFLAAPSNSVIGKCLHCSSTSWIQNSVVKLELVFPARWRHPTKLHSSSAPAASSF